VAYRKGTKSLETEEVRDLPSCVLSQDKYACRYVHSMLDGVTGIPTHLDGAVRIYDTEHPSDRIDHTIATAGDIRRIASYGDSTAHYQ
jgi:hypothetical protein